MPSGSRAASSFSSSGVAEALHLLVLCAQVADAVPHDVDEGEHARDRGCGHVAGDDRKVLLGCFASELVDHRLRQLYTGD
jgi:hypothetical protein